MQLLLHEKARVTAPLNTMYLFVASPHLTEKKLRISVQKYIAIEAIWEYLRWYMCKILAGRGFLRDPWMHVTKRK
jgi:hypothetical protein